MIDHILTFLAGLASGLLVEWMRRRAARIQIIPLVVRMNRLVQADIAGFTLARVTGPGSPPEIITDLREYQFTLKNTSNVHLQDAEIQFEFPAQEVQALTERPTRSNTSLVQITCDPPGDTSVFRWRIPQFPATDSVDFTFRAIKATSDKFEVSLYKSDRVVVRSSIGEPSSDVNNVLLHVGSGFATVLAMAFIGASIGAFFSSGYDSSTQVVTQAGCTLKVSSTVFASHTHAFWPASGPWEITHSIENFGAGDCTINDPALFPNVDIAPGRAASARVLSIDKPKLADRDVMLGNKATAMQAANIRLYSARP